jgi:hypothetical protein
MGATGCAGATMTGADVIWPLGQTGCRYGGASPHPEAKANRAAQTTAVKPSFIPSPFSLLK